MGKGDSKLSNVPSFDHIKSVKKSISNRQKNFTQNISNEICISNEKSNRFVENMILVWLDISTEKTNDANERTLNSFRRVINLVEIFSDLEKCYEFLNSIQQEKILFIVSGSFGPQILPRIDKFEQIYSIYIFCGNKANHIEWTKAYTKIKGIHTQIKDLCIALRYDLNQYDKSLTSISILPYSLNVDINQTNKEFICLQVVKNILLDIQYDLKFRQEFINFSRQFYFKNEQQLNIIDTFENSYQIHSPIWWYSRKCFIYRMLKKAFYKQDYEIIYKFSFFIRDLHKEIKKSYLQSHNHQYHAISVYRSARLTFKEFENIEKNQDGLLSFNDFIYTTLERSIALKFAQKLRNDLNTIAIIYKINIDPTKSSIPFIALNNLTYLPDNNGEILLSMNTIFHINSIEKICERLYEITLSPVSKKDPQIINLVEYMQNITHGLYGWYKLTKILMEINEYTQVENIYKNIFEQINENQYEERAFILHELGYIYDLKNDLINSISYYKQALDIYLHYLPNNHLTLLSTYINLASVYDKQGDLNSALEKYQDAIKIEKSDNPNIIFYYNNIGIIYQKQKKYSESQQTFEKTIQICQKKFPSAYPLLADTYHNLGGLFYFLKDYSKALNYYEITLENDKKAFLSTHPSIISTHFNIATTYEALKDYKQAIKYAELCVEKSRLVFGNEHIETKENLQYLQQLQEKFETIKL